MPAKLPEYLWIWLLCSIQVDRLKSELDESKQIIQRLTEEKLQAIQERDVSLKLFCNWFAFTIAFDA